MPSASRVLSSRARGRWQAARNGGAAAEAEAAKSSGVVGGRREVKQRQAKRIISRQGACVAALAKSACPVAYQAL